MILYYTIQIRKRSVELPGNDIFSSGELDLWPMTLTFQIDLDMIQVDLHIKFLVHTSNSSVVRLPNYRQTDTHTDRYNIVTRLIHLQGPPAKECVAFFIELYKYNVAVWGAGPDFLTCYCLNRTYWNIGRQKPQHILIILDRSSDIIVVIFLHLWKWKIWFPW